MVHPTQRRQARDDAVGAFKLPVRKREIRGFGRSANLIATGLLALNLITFHSISIISLPWAATVLFLIAAVGNLVAAFSEDLSVHSFMASITGLALAMGTGFTFVMQSGAAELDSRALASGLDLLSIVIEVSVIGWNLGLTLVGTVADDLLNQVKRRT